VVALRGAGGENESRGMAPVRLAVTCDGRRFTQPPPSAGLVFVAPGAPHNLTASMKSFRKIPPDPS